MQPPGNKPFGYIDTSHDVVSCVWLDGTEDGDKGGPFVLAALGATVEDIVVDDDYDGGDDDGDDEDRKSVV